MHGRNDIECVIVSPLRRTIATAYHLLKGHPRFDELRIVFEPVCREHIHTTGDIPSPLSKAVRFAEMLFPAANIDSCSLFESYSDKENYFLEDLDQAT